MDLRNVSFKRKKGKTVCTFHQTFVVQSTREKHRRGSYMRKVGKEGGRGGRDNTHK